ncbi:MAG: xanthine dehydrogenase family protein molybdopterin-binding subunit [Pseudomonadota bacterium]|nr:xanthine dehydrogenase family protein molybdopterin-binding subunit [Pseudomonadota bacterium]
MSSIGKGIDRVDGRLKVMGAATFTAEHKLPRLAHGLMVTSTIPNGRIAAFDLTAAEAMPGVIAIVTPANAPKLPKQEAPPPGAQANPKLSLLQDDLVHYNGQPIAIVIAETFEQARAAAHRVRVRYTRTPATLDFAKAKQQLRKAPAQPDRPADTSRGNVSGSLARADVRIDRTYSTPLENHNPMEPHASIASWDGARLTIYDSTQNVTGVKKTAAKTFGIAPENIHVVSPFVGGGFGSKGTTWSHVMLAAMAAKVAGRPVKLAVERTQMYGPVGARPMTEQHLQLGAARDGKLTAQVHHTICSNSFVDDFSEPCSTITRALYQSDSLQTTQRMATMHLGVQTYMRAPGESSGSFALESAMDELAYALNIDPVALRLQNYADKDPEKDIPFSSKSLRECYRLGAERFGWDKRNPAPRSMRIKDTLVGWGMATATYPANRQKAKASAVIHADGSALVQSGTHELGTGAYTIMTQIAGDALGLPVAQVTFQLGDSAMPEAPVSGGSQTTASVGPAVHAAASAARDKLIAIAIADQASPLAGATASDIVAADGWLSHRTEPSRRERFSAIVARHASDVRADSEAAPGDEKKQFSMHSFGAVFVEVHVDADLGTIRVPRVVGVYGIGKLMNAKTGHSQLMGGVVWGLGMGLMEKTEIDARTGRAVNANLADYHVPVNADIGLIDVSVVEEHDPYINALGAKGIGEIGIVGVAAALANAVYHATGKRIRSLPITPDKLV